ncbi:hypothetical protein EBBID32_11090 [Sphingobium indicum BiD32]|uniref:Uncharacterized protein n=1 Tax=Sphingobium indicum BiD32 TaxID=1301087 RepID=N1MIK3_9SPHN|nr:hypothetical protein [Sphingobium indicum]CCW16771.1 hypothetical protein EBBID32_11090 [Sphingobium indicum BiD32]
MQNLLPIIISAMLLGACDRQEDARNGSSASAADERRSDSPTIAAAKRPDAHWVLQANAEATVLVLQTQAGHPILSLTCPSEEKRLQVNVPGFTPIGSEDRLSIGSAGEVEALVADFRGDRQLGGVTATGAVPSNLAALVGGPVSASYGSQTSGPHPAVPQDVVRSFVAGCRNRPAAGTPHAGMPGRLVSPCLVQDGRELSAQPMRAIGTEPFWAARIEGRCVTYSHPEDQPGTRLWTRYTATQHGGMWTGALDGRPFVLRTRKAPSCSDGMSDKSYPVAVELMVHDERRKGCAEPV